MEIETKVLLFGGLKKFFSADYRLSLGEEATGDFIIQYFKKLNPEADTVLDACQLAVDGSVVSKQQMIGKAREVALLPPFSGG